MLFCITNRVAYYATNGASPGGFHGQRPRHGPRRGHRRRHRRQQPRAPPRAAGLARHRADRPGAVAQPGGLHRSRVELHLPRGPLPRDHGPDPRLRGAVPGDGRLHEVRRLRDRPHRGADGGAPPQDVQRQGVGHRGRAGLAGVRQGEGPVHRDRPVHRRVLATRCRRRRLAPRGDDHAGGCDRGGSAYRRTQCRGSRHGHRRGSGRPPTDQSGTDRRRRHRRGARRDRVRRLEPEDR